MQYKNINKKDYIGKHQKRWQPRKNHYIPNNFPPPFIVGQRFKTETWDRTYIFTITDVGKISQYKTFVYDVELETWEKEYNEEVWKSSYQASANALANTAGPSTVMTVTLPPANNTIQTNSNLMQSQTSYYAWSIDTEPKAISNMNNSKQISHNTLINMDKEEITETDYAIFLLQGNMIQVEDEK